jgi:transposase-like protein
MVLKIGDLITPGSNQLRFGSFDTVEIRMLSIINVDDTARVVINEYGSNFEKSKSDPLTIIEANKSICGSSRAKYFQLEDYMIKTGTSKSLPTIAEEKEELSVIERAVSVSPIKGSQGVPEVDISSQEEATQQDNQYLDWEIIQEEEGQKSDVTEIGMDRDKEADKEIVNMEINEEQITANTHYSVRLENVMTEETKFSLEKIKEQSEVWEKQAAKLCSSVAKNQKKGQDGWPEWKEVRQRKRLRDNGATQMRWLSKFIGIHNKIKYRREIILIKLLVLFRTISQDIKISTNENRIFGFEAEIRKFTKETFFEFILSWPIDIS